MLPWEAFIEFPATRITFEFSRSFKANQSPVLTRTGADPQDPDSGGQPIQISCAFQMTFVQESLHKVYLSFGSLQAAMERYTLLSSNMISNTAQRFTPQDFWKRRQVISGAMLVALNKTIWEHGHATVQMFEVMKAVNRAKIANISAGAHAKAKEIAAGATRDAFNLKQAMKADKYNEIQKRLKFDAPQLTEY